MLNRAYFVNSFSLRLIKPLGVLGKDNIRNLAKTVIKACEKSQYLIRVEESSQLTALRLVLLNALSVMK